jgi:hypothetical protein
MLGTSVCDLHDLDVDPKNPRARRGSSKTKVQLTSTWRMESSHQ